jgi:hypothetical protein
VGAGGGLLGLSGRGGGRWGAAGAHRAASSRAALQGHPPFPPPH